MKASKFRLKVISPGKFENPDNFQDVKPESEPIGFSVPIDLIRDIPDLCPAYVGCHDMEPTIMGESVVIVDCDDKVLIENHIYVFEFPVNQNNTFTGVTLRRVLSIHEHGVVVGVDKIDHPIYFIENEALKVLGKIKVIGTPTEVPGKYSWAAVSNKSRYVQ